jgi:NADH dehydrogenase
MTQISDRLVTVFGGSGFIGRYVVRALAKRGYRVRVAVRRPDLARFLMTSGAVGQIQGVQANLRYPDSVEAAADGADAVVNLVGILYPRGRNTFEAAQAFGPGAVARAARSRGAAHYVHVSAIGADRNSPAEYGRSKAKGEEAAREAYGDVVIMRPSVVFGPEDDFFNRFAAMARMSPVLPLIGGGETQFQPVFVGDVAEAIASAVDGAATPGTTYELGGPEILTFRRIIELVLEITRRKRLLVPVPYRLANLQAAVLEFLPTPPLTRDQVALLKTHNVVAQSALAERRTLSGLGIDPASVDAVVPSYLWRFRKYGQFEKAMTAQP